MENVNKLSFLQYKINEKLIYTPMENIVQQYDNKKFATNPYLFKILYVDKYIKKTNEFIVYLGPPKESKLPIVKAIIPLEIIRTSKLIPNYDYVRVLDEDELFIINERIFRKINEINIGKTYYILCYGYLINQYKDDNALTTVKEGIQQFRLISDCPKKFKGRGFETSCFISDKPAKILELYPIIKDKINFRDFKKLPKGFLIERK